MEKFLEIKEATTKLLTTKLKELMVQDIKYLMVGKLTSVKVIGVSLGDVVTHLEELGFTESRDLESNGWQMDFWMQFTNGDVTYDLGGSGYYGNSISINLNTDKDE